MKRIALAALSAAVLASGCIPGSGPFHRPYPAQQPTYGAPAASPAPSAAPAAYRTSPSFGLPRSYAEFRERCMSACTTPEGAVKMYFDAVFCYIADPRSRENANMLRFILHQNRNWERSPNFSTFVERLKDPACHHIFRSFAYGTSPANDYAMAPANYRVMIDDIRFQEAGVAKVTLISSGADSPRLITVRQYEDGLWYMFGNAGTYSQVRSPASASRSYGHDAAYDSYR